MRTVFIWLKTAACKYFTNYKPLAPFLLVLFAFSIVQLILGRYYDWGRWVNLLLNSTISPLLWVHCQFACLRVARGQIPSFMDVRTRVQLTLRIIIANFILGIIVLVGFLLLIVPGIFWWINYSFIFFLMLDKNSGILDSFKHSKLLVMGKRLQLFLLLCVTILLGVVYIIVYKLLSPSLPMRILMNSFNNFLIFPIVTIALALAYEEAMVSYDRRIGLLEM